MSRYIEPPTAKDKIKQAWNENPIGVATVVGGLLIAASKFIDAVSGIWSRRAYSRQGSRAKRK